MQGQSTLISDHFIWEILDEGDIELVKVHTKENLVDMLTKVIFESEIYTL